MPPVVITRSCPPSTVPLSVIAPLLRLVSVVPEARSTLSSKSWKPLVVIEPASDVVPPPSLVRLPIPVKLLPSIVLSTPLKVSVRS